MYASSGRIDTQGKPEAIPVSKKDVPGFGSSVRVKRDHLIPVLLSQIIPGTQGASGAFGEPFTGCAKLD